MKLFKIKQNRETEAPPKSEAWAAICYECNSGFVAVERGRGYTDERNTCESCRDKKSKKKWKEDEEYRTRQNNKKTIQCNNCTHWVLRFDWHNGDFSGISTASCHGDTPAKGWPDTEWNDRCGVFLSRYMKGKANDC